jgi:hypothetical protein
MKKIYFSVILFTTIIAVSGKAQTSINEFESELRLLEQNELAQDQKADALIEKISVEDTVSDQKAAISKEVIPESPAPISQQLQTVKKIRRVPSR